MALLFGFGSSSLFGDFGQHGGIQQEEGSADKVFTTKSRETQKPPAQTQNNTPSAVLPDDKDIEKARNGCVALMNTANECYAEKGESMTAADVRSRAGVDAECHFIT